MQSTGVAAVSMNGRLGEPARVLDDIATWCERAALQGVDLVLFPELVVHGHCTPNTWALAEPVPGGRTTLERRVFGPDGGVLASSQLDRIRDEMVVATLEAASLAKQRAHPNYQLRTRRPELYGEPVREQLSS